MSWSNFPLHFTCIQFMYGTRVVSSMDHSEDHRINQRRLTVNSPFLSPRIGIETLEIGEAETYLKEADLPTQELDPRLQPVAPAEVRVPRRRPGPGSLRRIRLLLLQRLRRGHRSRVGGEASRLRGDRGPLSRLNAEGVAAGSYER